MGAFYSVAGTQLALPDNARPDLAYTFIYVIGTTANPPRHVHTVPGGYLEIPVAGFFRGVTDATVQNRLGELYIQRADTSYVVNPVAASVQAASLIYQYSFAVGSVSAYGPIGTAEIFAVPAIAAMPTDTIGVGLISTVATDYIDSGSLTVIRVPTGPNLSTAAPQLVPTPLIA